MLFRSVRYRKKLAKSVRKIALIKVGDKVEMAKNPHTKFAKGRRLHIILKDGTQRIDRYIDRHSKHVEFEQSGRIPISAIRSLTYVKQPHGE